MKNTLLVLIIVSLAGCTDQIIIPAYDEGDVISGSFAESPIDGHWVGFLRDDELFTIHASWVIAHDGNQRFLGGGVITTDHSFPNLVPQPWPITPWGTGVAIVEGPELSWRTQVYLLRGTWDIRGKLVHSDTMLIRVSHDYPDSISTLVRSDDWLAKN